MSDDVQVELEVGRVYTAEELGAIFGFSPYYLRTAGGMVPVPQKRSLLLITHADQGASFEYGDYWDGDDLIYTGRGQDGDQVLSGSNRDVAENRRHLWIFERQEKYQRRYLGRAICTAHWWSVAPDKNGVSRRVLRFCLRLEAALATEASPTGSRRPFHRRPRAFGGSAPSAPSPGSASTTPEEVAQLIEKANAIHHGLLTSLKRWLEARSWTDIQEIPTAVDMWARHGQRRVLFEAKTISSDTELAQTRAAIAQLLEYRYFYGTQSDCLCLVTNRPLSDRRLRLLAALGIDVLWCDGEMFVPSGDREGLFVSGKT
jgi:hypothetical protein